VTQTPVEPIIVRITEPPVNQLEGLADVLLGALGLTGVIAVTAVLVGVVVGTLMFWLRSRAEQEAPTTVVPPYPQSSTTSDTSESR
jgi:hypothetical protein